MELKQSGTKITAEVVDILRLIDTSDLYGLINDGINKYNDCNTVQGFINDIMVGNTNTATVVENDNKTTTVSKSGKAVVTKQPRRVNWGKPNLSLYMKTTMVTRNSPSLD